MPKTRNKLTSEMQARLKILRGCFFSSRLLASALLILFAVALAITALNTDAALEYASTKLRIPGVALPLVRDPGSAVRIGMYYFNGKTYNLDTAFRAFEKALELDPATETAHYQMGRIFFLKGKLWEALQETNREIAAHPDWPNPYYLRGLIEAYARQFDKAEKDFTKFVESAPSNWAGYNDLAWVQLEQEKYREAKETLLLAFKNLPGEERRNVWLWSNLGVAELNSRNYNEAREAFLRSLEITEKTTAEFFWSAYPGNDPRDAEKAFLEFKSKLYLNLAVTYAKLGRRDEAMTELAKHFTIRENVPLSEDKEVRNNIEKLLSP